MRANFSVSGAGVPKQSDLAHVQGSIRLLMLTLVFLYGLAAGAEESQTERIERTARARPEQGVSELRPLVDQASSGELLDLLRARAGLLDRIPDDTALEADAVRVDALNRTHPDPSARALALMLAALPLIRHGPLGRAGRLLDEALEILPANAPPLLRLAILSYGGRAKEMLRKLDESLKMRLQAVALADHLGVAWRRSIARSELAYTLWRASQPERAQVVNQDAIDIAHAAGDDSAESAALIVRSYLMSDAGRDDEDLRSTRAAIELSRRAGDTRAVALGLANLSDHYLRIGDNATALSLADEALPLARQVHSLSAESVALSNSGFAQILLGHHTEGIARVHQALATEQRSGAISSIADIQSELGTTLEKVGRLREAWEALRDYRRLADESFRRDQQEAVLELEEGVDAERRRTALADLNTENALQEAQLLGHDLQIRVWRVAIAVGVLLLTLVAVLVRRLRHSNAQLISSNVELKVASESDPLTALANRRHFQLEMDRANPVSGGFEGALVLIDIDHFKRINDQYGHAAGDAVLIEVAQRLRKALRDGDMAVRWGGEEFLVAVRAMPLDQVEALAQRLLSAIGDHPVEVQGKQICVTASLGFASFPLDPARRPVSWERAIDLVDTAMYLAKAHGRNRAYGVRSLEEEEGAGPPGAPDALESAWRGGRADLTHLHGPSVGAPLS
jgi:diguanylate cyclase (GGDEF)-like protein